MSIKAMNKAFEITIEPSDKLIVLSIADNADDDFRCFPSYTNIAKKASVSRRTVMRAVKKFEKCELLKKEDRYKKNKQTSNIYTLQFEKFDIEKYIEESPRFKKKMEKKKTSDKLTPVTTDDTKEVTTDDTKEVTTYCHTESPLNPQKNLHSNLKEKEREIIRFKNRLVEEYKGKHIVGIEANNYAINGKGYLTINNNSVNREEAFKAYKLIFENQDKIIDPLSIYIGKEVIINSEIVTIKKVDTDSVIIEKEGKYLRINANINDLEVL